jgi:hypothetical protein
MEEQRLSIVEAESLSGEKRKYTFVLMDAETGLELFHDYVSLLISQIRPMINSVITFLSKENAMDEVASVMGGAEILRELLPYEKVKELCQKMLVGAKVETENAVYEIGESGIGAYTAGDPLEVYLSIYHALRANYKGVELPLQKAGRLLAEKIGGEAPQDTDESQNEKTSKDAAE